MSSRSSRYNTRSGASSDKSQDEDIGSISSATPQTQQPENTENEISLRLKKQKDIQEVWAKRNKAVFKVLGKMTAGAYQAALKNVKWEKRFKKKGKNMQVHYLK